MKLPFDLKDIKPGSFSYLTKRKLENAKKEEVGEIILWKEVGKEESKYVMKCPFCGKEQEGSVILVKRPYRVKCSACDKTINLPKIIDKAKKEEKME